MARFVSVETCIQVWSPNDSQALTSGNAGMYMKDTVVMQEKLGKKDCEKNHVIYSHEIIALTFSSAAEYRLDEE